MNHDTMLTRLIMIRLSTVSHSIAMSSSTGITFVERADDESRLSKLPNNDSQLPQIVNTDSVLPTHFVSPPIHTPALSPSSTQAVRLSIDNAGTAPDETSTWIKHVKEYAPVVGVVGTVLGVIVAIITVAVK